MGPNQGKQKQLKKSKKVSTSKLSSPGNSKNGGSEGTSKSPKKSSKKSSKKSVKGKGNKDKKNVIFVGNLPLDSQPADVSGFLSGTAFLCRHPYMRVLMISILPFFI